MVPGHKTGVGLGAEVGEAIQVGIGLHVGPLVLGRIGHPESASITVIGKTVNAGARLEAMTKELKCQLVISKECADKAGQVHYHLFDIGQPAAQGDT